MVTLSPSMGEGVRVPLLESPLIDFVACIHVYKNVLFVGQIVGWLNCSIFSGINVYIEMNKQARY